MTGPDRGVQALRKLLIALVTAALARPLLEFVLKDLVGRARPDLERMVNGQG